MRQVVTLTITELMLAWNVAIMRHAQNVKLGSKPKYGSPTGTAALAINLMGCEGEMAAAKALGQYWSGQIGRWTASDVGPYEVRTIDKPTNNLIIHPEDDDNAPFILVEKKTAQKFHLCGWMFGKDCKQNDWWVTKTGRPAYFVPRDKLNSDFTEMLEWGKRERASAVNTGP